MTTAIAFTQAFRLFFPLAALFTAVHVLLWIAGLSGMLHLPAQPTLWHAHEMLFGFAFAIIAGFVLTAAGNWTGLKTTTPNNLLLLAGLWIIARIASLVFSQTPIIAITSDSLFLIGLALLVSRVLLRSANRRNYLFLPFLWGLAAVNLSFHISLLRGNIELARLLITLTAWLVGFLMVFMGGRVIPFFTGRRCHYQPIQQAWLNWASTVSSLMASCAIALAPLSNYTTVLAALAAVTILLRLYFWLPWRVWKEPMLWILHIGYAWLGAAYLLAALVHGGWLQPLTLPLHALMAGALGCLGMGMMTRVALGHSGRVIQANPVIIAAFILVLLAGLLRVASYLNWSGGGLAGLTLSAIFWALAFGLYFIVFAPLLWRMAASPPKRV